ncbi:MAG: P-II family nitrogen regulator [Clostridiales bacterium]|nr:P-II family nitrogen regulator [Clostridiales bacterium]
MSGISKIEIITAMSKLSVLKQELSKLGVSGMTVVQAIGCGVQKGTKEYEIKENVEMELLPKELIMLIVENEKIKDILEVIKKALYTGHIGDGKIVVTPVSDIIRIRTGEDGIDALR